MGAKAGFVSFVLGLLVSQGFLGAKAFFSVVREGVADKPGDILCCVFFVLSLGFWACLGARGSRDFIFFTGTLWKGSFLMENPGGFFLPFLLLPLLIFCFCIFYVPYVFFLL